MSTDSNASISSSSSLSSPVFAVSGSVRLLLRLEGLALFALATLAYALVLRADGWLYAALFLAPDLALFGYLAGPRVGAAAYNTVHATLGPALLAALGLGLAPEVLPLSLIWFAHIGLDRMLGYGLKYASAFGHTHLGVGRAALMPAPAKVDRAGIVSAALAILEAQGEAGVTMGAVADALGIKAPSLYKHFGGRAMMLVAVRAEGFRAIGRSGARHKGDIRALAEAYRAFARRRPALYGLLFAANLPADVAGDPDWDARAAGAEPLFALLRAHLGAADPARLLEVARVFTAFMHGFVSMELAGAFQLGPGQERAYLAGVDALWAALVR